jgi:hypothetical protein
LSFDQVAPQAETPARVEARAIRSTRTLVFLDADMMDASGVQRIAASAIYKII